jgi:hypothetical protein
VSRTEDTNGDLTAVGNEEFADGLHRFDSGWRKNGSARPREAMPAQAVVSLARKRGRQSQTMRSHAPGFVPIVPCLWGGAYRGS